MRNNALEKGFAIMVALLLLPWHGAYAGEGFGMLRKRANLARVHPPQVRIGGSRIAIRSTSQSNKYATAAERIKSQLESELLGSDPSLRLDSKTTDISIDLSILQNDYSEAWETRTGMRNVQTGNDEKGRPVFQARQMEIRYKVVKHLFSLAFKVSDVKTKSVLAADTIKENYKQDFEDGNGAPDAASLEENRVATVVTDLTRRLTPTREIIGVLLPRGRLDDAVPFGEAGMWTKYLEAIEKTPQMPNPVNESYRQYAMGIAYEALGYGAEDLDTSLKYLEQAAVLYNGAAEANPREKYFIRNSKSQPSFLGRAKVVATNLVPNLPGVSSQKKGPADPEEISDALVAPLTRVQAALVQYQRMKELGTGAAPRPTQLASTPTGAKSLSGGAAEPGDPPLTNAGIIEMLQGGVPESVIFTAINSAARTAFDVSPQGLIALAEARASEKLLDRIQTSAAKKSSTKTSSKKKGS